MIEIDFHVHSSASFDGVMSPGVLLRCARRAGLSGIAVVDHGTTDGGVAALALNDEPNFIVIVGQETQTELGDVVGLFLTRPIRARDAQRVIVEIHEQGGLAVLPHPYKRHPVWPAALLLSLDGVELANARARDPFDDEARHEFSEPFELAELAGSDGHLPWEVGAARTLVDCSPGDADSVRQAIIDRSCVPLLSGRAYSPAAILTSKIVKRLRRLR